MSFLFPICLIVATFMAQAPLHPMLCCFRPGVSALGKLAVVMLRISVLNLPDGAQVIAGWLLGWPGMFLRCGDNTQVNWKRQE